MTLHACFHQKELALTMFANSDLPTTAINCMLIEIGSGLCAICLPSLAGLLKVQGIQNFISGIPYIFSSRPAIGLPSSPSEKL